MTGLDLRSWIARSESTSDTITPGPARALAATLGHSNRDVDCGSELPPLWHWLYCLALPLPKELATDGNVRGGSLRPELDLPTRMFAGSRIEFCQPLRFGEPVSRTSTIADITEKVGRSGPMIFLTLRHHWCRDGAPEPAIVEEQDVVYRPATRPGEQPLYPSETLPVAQWRRTVVPEAVLLFRYSALTFNSHRIHYDRRYAMDVEGYPGLVVQGPLTATLLLDHLWRERPSARVQRFTFKAQAPLYDSQSFDLCGCNDGEGAVSLWAVDPNGRVAMRARAELA